MFRHRGAPRGWGSWAAVAYPLLLVIYPTLSVAQSRSDSYVLSDLLTIVGAALAFTVAVFALCVAGVRLLGLDATLERAAALTLVGVLWTFYFTPLQTALEPVGGPLAKTTVLGAACLAATAVWTYVALRPRWTLGGVAKYLALASALLVVVAVGVMAKATLGARARIERSAAWRQAHASVAVYPARAAPGPKRDIYVIVLDGYPNAAVLRARFGYENAPFLDSLRALGFTIPRRVHANYSSTVVSLASMLNGEHMTSLARDVRPGSNEWTIPAALIRENRAARFLRARGYRYVLFPSHWFEPTRASPLADDAYRGPAAGSPLVALRRTELRRVMFGSTLLDRFSGLRRSDGAAFVLDEFRLLRDVPARQEPTFTVAHFLLPHQPIVLDGACRPVNPGLQLSPGHELAMPGARDEFLGAVRCANRQVLALATALLRAEGPRPIVIVIGDHGTLSRGWTARAKLPVDSVGGERLAALGAFYMPDGGDRLFADSTSHVNIFRSVLRHYFGADLPPLPNDGYFNDKTAPYRFSPVNARSVLGG